MNDKTKRLWIVLDDDGNPFGPFDDAQAAAKWARDKWPDLQEVADYDVVALRGPD